MDLSVAAPVEPGGWVGLGRCGGGMRRCCRGLRDLVAVAEGSCSSQPHHRIQDIGRTRLVQCEQSCRSCRRCMSLPAINRLKSCRLPGLWAGSNSLRASPCRLHPIPDKMKPVIGQCHCLSVRRRQFVGEFETLPLLHSGRPMPEQLSKREQFADCSGCPYHCTRNWRTPIALSGVMPSRMAIASCTESLV